METVSEKTEKGGEKTAKRFSGVARWIDKHPVTFIAALSVLVTLTVEILCRQSLFAALSYMVCNPIRFLANAAIIFAGYAVSLLFKRRYSLIFIFSLVWLGLAIADCVMMNFRITPLSMNDILLLKSVITIIDVYLNVFEIVIICIAFVLAVTAIVFVIIKQKKRGVSYLKVGVTVGVSLAVTAAILITGKYSDTVSRDYANISAGYRKYGFPFSFCISTIDRGIDKPSDYSKENIEDLRSLLASIGTNEIDPDTNIVFLQLESFFDVNYLKNASFSENPLPFFTSLKEKCSHAFLSVPALGAGTANTEFEIITQMNIDDFGVGEVPYKSVMQDTTCETVNYVLKELGYSCHAIHNHQGTFYNRDKVYADLGFDTFTSVEYMNGVKTTPMGWAKDDVLVGEIIKCLDSTKGLDYIYAISVQGHGKYPDDHEGETEIKVNAGLEDSHNAFEYYVNQIHEMDAFLEDLIDALSQYDEKVILVLYGDHLPSFEIAAEDLENGDIFQTEYVVWTNADIKTDAVDLQAYELTSYVMSLLGCNNGILTKYHQNFKGNEEYLENLKELEYDILYGNKYYTSGENPFVPTVLQMGTYPVTVRSCELIGEALFISGNGFTPSSVVLINGDTADTIFVNENTLIISPNEIAENEECLLCVEQRGADGQTLSTTESISISDYVNLDE